MVIISFSTQFKCRLSIIPEYEDREGKVKREKYSWLNYLMKGKWKMISDMSFDVVRNLREEEYEKLSLNSRMD